MIRSVGQKRSFGTGLGVAARWKLDQLCISGRGDADAPRFYYYIF